MRVGQGQTAHCPAETPDWLQTFKASRKSNNCGAYVRRLLTLTFDFEIRRPEMMLVPCGKELVMMSFMYIVTAI